MWMIYSRYTVSVTRRIGHTLALDSPQKIDRVIVIARNFASWQKKEHSNQHTEALRQESRGTMDGDQLLPVASGDDSEDQSRKKPQFGTRFLTDPKNVFQHNAWDNVVWDEEQEKEARQKTQEQLQNALSVEKQEEYEREADQYWDKFYSQHQNRFFKDRHWLFTEFPELYSSRGNTVRPPVSQKPNETPDDCAVLEQACSGEATAAAESVEANRNRDSLDDGGLKTVSDAAVSRTDESLSEKASHLSLVKDCVTKGEPGHKTEDMTASAEESSELVNNSVDAAEENSDCVISQEQGKTTHSVTAAARSESFPGESATFRVFEVGCGVGNTVFPVLYTNNDPGLMMYCCDFSSTAVQLVKENRDYDSKRCHAFVWDITDENSPLPFPPESLDIIIMIFVLSAVHPDKMQQAVDRLASCLKPGGMILLRDYGRYDMAQLRFKKGRCLGENFYVRGDGTRVYFFTQEEFRNMFQKAGLQEVQNLIDRRLQVNRGRQIKMYRVWIQCKYRKPLKGDKREDDVEKGLPMS